MQHKFVCSKCGLTGFPTINGLETHIVKHHFKVNALYKCWFADCSEPFATEVGRLQHMHLEQHLIQHTHFETFINPKTLMQMADEDFVSLRLAINSCLNESINLSFSKHAESKVDNLQRHTAPSNIPGMRSILPKKMEPKVQKKPIPKLRSVTTSLKRPAPIPSERRQQNVGKDNERIGWNTGYFDHAPEARKIDCLGVGSACSASGKGREEPSITDVTHEEDQLNKLHFQREAEREGARTQQKRQAEQMLEGSAKRFAPIPVGQTVRVPIPMVDRAKTDPRTFPAASNRLNESENDGKTKGTVEKNLAPKKVDDGIERFISFVKEDSFKSPMAVRPQVSKKSNRSLSHLISSKRLNQSPTPESMKLSKQNFAEVNKNTHISTSASNLYESVNLSFATYAQLNANHLQRLSKGDTEKKSTNPQTSNLDKSRQRAVESVTRRTTAKPALENSVLNGEQNKLNERENLERLLILGNTEPIDKNNGTIVRKISSRPFVLKDEPSLIDELASEIPASSNHRHSYTQQTNSGGVNSSRFPENLISSERVEHANSVVKDEPSLIDELIAVTSVLPNHNNSITSNIESAALSLPSKRSKMETVSALLDENNKRTDCEKSFVVKDEPSTQLQSSSSLVVKDEPSLIDELASMIPAPSNHNGSFPSNIGLVFPLESMSSSSSSSCSTNEFSSSTTCPKNSQARTQQGGCGKVPKTASSET